jgi:hypothetical protein
VSLENILPELKTVLPDVGFALEGSMDPRERFSELPPSEVRMFCWLAG